MVPLFSPIRYIIYGTVLAWSIIVLGVAAFLNHILVASPLTRFVPLAIFIASTTLFILVALLIFGLLPGSTLISQTRSELTAVAFSGVLWLGKSLFFISSGLCSGWMWKVCAPSLVRSVFGRFCPIALGVHTSTQALADVECDDDDFKYDTRTYHAQYRVLQAFSLFNAILLWSFLLFFLYLSFRHHCAGHHEIWTSKATAYSCSGPAKNRSRTQSPYWNPEKRLNKREFGLDSGELPLPATAMENRVCQNEHGRSGGSERYVHGKGRGQGAQRNREGKAMDNDGYQGVVPPKVPGKDGLTYVVFIPPPTTQQHRQIYPSRVSQPVENLSSPRTDLPIAARFSSARRY
jgi:hypothetical protein